MRPVEGTVTLLFTDLEGSSRLWEAHPGPMSNATVRHDYLTLEIITRHNGVVFKSLGDGACCVFADAHDALLAASELQSAIKSEPWPEGTPLKVRIGVHTGEVERRGDDYFGHAVNLVARLVESGHGEQTLLTAETQKLVDGDYSYLGRFKLRGIHQTQHIYQLGNASFPRLRGTEAMPNNLPEQVNSFVGRDQEMREVRELLESTRLLTLLGMGGTGKTRLSLQLGAEILRSAEAVWFVELAPVSDSRLVPAAVASALGISIGSQPAIEATVEFLRDKNLVLILDNCEHVIEAAATLADSILKRVPGCRILASSREPLGVVGEVAYRLQMLPVPKENRHLTAEEVNRYGAVRLFVDRAKAASSEFDADRQNPQALASLCARLDGIPLAIELAAARVRSMTVEQILSRLDDRFRLLTGGSRAALPRQRTLKALVDWSYELLEPAERDMLLRLSVFVGSWDLAAAETVTSCDTIDEYDVLDLLCSLSDKSLIIRDTRDQENPRYRLLETVRQYAAEKMLEVGGYELTELREKHATYYLGFAEGLADKLVGAEAAWALNRLDEENDNVRAALVWFAESEPGAVSGLRLVVAMQRFWMTRGYLREGWERARIALNRPDCPQDGYRTLALFTAAFCAMNLGEVEAARDCLRQALDSAQRTGDRMQEGRAYSGLAGIAGDYDLDYQTSFDYNRRALEIHAEVGNNLGQAAANYNLADLTIRHDPRLLDPATAGEAISDAENYFRAGLALFSGLADVKHQGICLNGLAVVAQRQNNLYAAQQYYTAALKLFNQVSDTMWC
jgi:predicted ATPase/class 3 adenylate cyclase